MYIGRKKYDSSYKYSQLYWQSECTAAPGNNMCNNLRLKTFPKNNIEAMI